MADAKDPKLALVLKEKVLNLFLDFHQSRMARYSARLRPSLNQSELQLLLTC